MVEASSRKSFAKGNLVVDGMSDFQNGMVKVSFEVAMDGAELWSSESPFLYELLSTMISPSVGKIFGEKCRS